MRAIPMIIAAVVLALLGGVVVWQRSALTAKSYDIGRSEADLRRLEEQNRVYQAELSRLTSNEMIKSRVIELGLPLEAPGLSRPGTTRRH